MTRTQAFFLLHRDMPRQGPGHPDATSRALWIVPGLPARPRILDLGCGPGGQTMTLAQLLPDAQITAVDNHPRFLDELRAAARAAGVAEQIDPVLGDMADPPEGPFDLIWCEGAANLIGVERALREWTTRLVPGGSIALTDAVWLTDTPSARVRACWEEYPDMRTLEGLRQIVRASDLELDGDFVLGEESWARYYEPLQARVDALRPSAEGALVEVLDEAQEEIDVRREAPHAYSYAFVVATLPDPDDDRG